MTPGRHPLVERLTQLLLLMRDVIAVHAVKAGDRQPLMVAFCVRLSPYLDRLGRLVHRWQTGTLPKPRPKRAPRPKRTPPPPRPGQRILPPVPRRRGWLIHLVQPVAQYHEAFRDFLTRDDLRQLVADAPQAGRLILPLCHAHAITPPDWLRLPRRARQPRPKKPAPAQRPANTPPQPPDRPIQPYVLEAARVWKPRYG